MTRITEEMKSAYDWLLDPVVHDRPGEALVIANPSGWKDDGGPDDKLEEDITLDEFYKRLAGSTIIYQDVPALQSAHDWLKTSIVQNRPHRLVTIYDPDGWRHDDGVTMETPISLEDFLVRFRECTKYSYLTSEDSLSN